MNRYLTGHVAQFVHSDFPTYYGLAKTGIVLILQVDEQRSDLGFVLRACVSVDG